eukprot:TRINITY_DN61249_c0_g2_i1.p1 TRINITY_DN61249_c0_g2~~TRINITY_DN61249_c0_g2_i1.p1  ORF type:complete len:539 (-),score=-12.41 TRINITY_DN61249_c0_g2_i1:43-1659(-)
MRQSTFKKSILLVVVALAVVFAGATFLYNEKIDKVIKASRSYTGVRYQIGGMDRKGIDCSALMLRSFEAVGYKLPRVSWMQATIGKPVPLDKLQLGDLVFFGHLNSTKVSHVGMVTVINSKTDIKFINATCSKGVMESNLYSNYWKSRLLKARRVPLGGKEVKDDTVTDDVVVNNDEDDDNTNNVVAVNTNTNTTTTNSNNSSNKGNNNSSIKTKFNNVIKGGGNKKNNSNTNNKTKSDDKKDHHLNVNINIGNKNKGNSNSSNKTKSDENKGNKITNIIKGGNKKDDTKKNKTVTTNKGNKSVKDNVKKDKVKKDDNEIKKNKNTVVKNKKDDNKSSDVVNNNKIISSDNDDNKSVQQVTTNKNQGNTNTITENTNNDDNVNNTISSDDKKKNSLFDKVEFGPVFFGADNVVKKAKSYLGTPFKKGGFDEKGIDVVGLLSQAFSKVDAFLPEKYEDFKTMGVKADLDYVEMGDVLLFVAEPGKTEVIHAGMISEIKGNSLKGYTIKFIHVLPDKGVIETTVNSKYWRERVLAVRRLY